MSVTRRIFASLALVFAAGTIAHGQAQSSAVQTLLERARTLQQSGRGDIAAQTYRQVLLSDPNNVEAIAGLARNAKLAGNETESQSWLRRLAQVSPNDPRVAEIQAMPAASQNARLAKAGKLAESGDYAGAMREYRAIFGNTPPPGEWALAYYETQAAIESERPQAIAGLRAEYRKNPSDPRIGIALGRILTYSAKTRPEGRQILSKFPNDTIAKDAIRQSLYWDSQNINSVGAIQSYLKKNPDPELAARLKETQERQAKQVVGQAQSAEERQAYAALQGGRRDEAEQHFQAILEKQPTNPRALAGLGFLRMQQQNFSGAITYLSAAKQYGNSSTAVSQALDTSRFYTVLQQGTQALDANQLEEAEARFRQAIQMRPSSPEALQGLGGTLLKGQQAGPAAAMYERFVRLQPNSADGWKGLLSAQAQPGDNAAALATVKRIPMPVRAQLARDPEYLRTLSAVYMANGQSDDAQRVLEQALNLPFPDNGRNLRAEMQLQYAGLLGQSGRSAQAQALYLQILSLDPSNIDAWQGLISAYHAMGADAQALTTVDRMPPGVYESALRDPGFLSQLAAINQAQGRFEPAQQLLERAVALETSQGRPAGVQTQLQLAGIYLRQNNPARAYTVYRNVLTSTPERLDAWKGLLQTLHGTGHDREAIAQVQQIPANVRQKLNTDPEYLTTMAAVYASLGDNRLSLATLQQVESRYRAEHQVVPANVEIQHTWLLYNQGDEVGLYANLMDLGARGDLADDQRATVQTLWTTWSVRRAQQAADAGNQRLSMNILNAAARSFPDNPDVTKALAVGYLTGGDAKTAVKLYKKVDLANSQPGDYEAAVGAALAASDRKQAELWLRGALQQYPQDPKILTLAAKFEQSRGNNGRAKEYYQAALAAMPAQTAGETLQQTLRKPGPTILRPQPKPPQDDQQDLGTMLAPNASNTSRLAPQPRYLPGGTGDGGGAPVILNSSPAGARTRQPVPYVTGAIQAQAPLVQQRLQQEMMTLPPTPAPVVREYQQAPAVEYQQPAAQARQDLRPAGKYRPAESYSTADATSPGAFSEQRYVIPAQNATPRSSAHTASGKTYHKPAAQTARSRTARPQPYEGTSATGEEQYVVPQYGAPAPMPAPSYSQRPLSPQYQPVVPQPPSPKNQAEQQPSRPYVRPSQANPRPNVQYTQPVQQPTYIQPGNSTPQIAPDQQPLYTEPAPNVQLTQPLPQAAPQPQIEQQQQRTVESQPDSTEVDNPGAKTDTQRKRENQRQRIGDYNPPAGGSAVSWRPRRDMRAAWLALMQSVVYRVQRRATLMLASYSDYSVPAKRRTASAHMKFAKHPRVRRVAPQPASVNKRRAAVKRPPQRDQRSAITSERPGTETASTLRVTDQALPQLRYAPTVKRNFPQGGLSHGYLLRAASYFPDGQNTSTAPTTFQGQSNPPVSSKTQNCAVRQVTDCTPAKKRTTHPRRRATAAAAPATAYAEPVAEPLPQYQGAPVGPVYYGGQTATNGPDQPPPPGASDQELKNRNLPPLRGVDDRSHQQAQQVQISTREEDERALAQIEGGYSAWTGGTGYFSNRSGDLGFTRLNIFEAPFEASAPVGTTARMTVVVRPVLLNSGTPNPNNHSGPGGTPLLLGSFLPGQTPTFLPQQNAAGVGGELQFTTSTFGISGGYTPYGLLVANVTGALHYRPGGGNFTINAIRDSVKDTQLSYSGLRDPHTARPGFNGNVWGGVIATGGSLQYSKGGETSGFHASLGGQSITGLHVQDNTRIDGDAGAYFRVLSDPTNGDMTIGFNLFGMHYQHNLRFFTFGQGGYFSPESYVLLSVPVTYQGHKGLNFHYTVLGSAGVQAFQEDNSPFYPLDPTLQAAGQGATYPSQSVVSGNYDVQARAAYRVADHWYLGAFAQLSNSRDYNQQQGGFFIRYLFRPQYPSDDGATGLFPNAGLRPLLVP